MFSSHSSPDTPKCVEAPVRNEEGVTVPRGRRVPSAILSGDPRTDVGHAETVGAPGRLGTSGVDTVTRLPGKEDAGVDTGATTAPGAGSCAAGVAGEETAGVATGGGAVDRTGVGA